MYPPKGADLKGRGRLHNLHVQVIESPSCWFPLVSMQVAWGRGGGSGRFYFLFFFKDPERCQRHGSSCLDSQGLLLTQEYSSL